MAGTINAEPNFVVEPLNTLKSRVVDPNPDLYVF
jgi:hypothetical protein